MNNSTESEERSITLFTIGFTGKTAEEFFQKLRVAGVRRVVDVRLNNVSQLSGFTKKKDLEYFLRVIGGIKYDHDVSLAPTQGILKDYQNKRIDWAQYERYFNQLLQEREPSMRLRREDFDRSCLLCSEVEPKHCHRRLVAEYFQRKWGNMAVEHL
jgi:uncharacterized protein (DUF488 family)